MIVLSESTEQIEQSASASENKLMTDTAELLGFKVYHIPRDFERCSTAENALWHIPNYPKITAGIWIGYIPEFERYKAIYHAALDKGIKLLNTPLEHQTALEFDLFYPHLKGLTPDSLVITSTTECIEAGELLGFPVFVKGAVQSRKMQGWEAAPNSPTSVVARVESMLVRFETLNVVFDWQFAKRLLSRHELVLDLILF